MTLRYWVVNTGNGAWRGPFWFESTANEAAIAEAQESGREALVYFGTELCREPTGVRAAPVRGGENPDAPPAAAT